MAALIAAQRAQHRDTISVKDEPMQLQQPVPASCGEHPAAVWLRADSQPDRTHKLLVHASLSLAPMFSRSRA
jgi:hypothetical protein